MRYFLIIFMSLMFWPALAQAEPKILWGLDWDGWHFYDMDFEKRLLDPPTIPNNAQWRTESQIDGGWRPQDWVAARGGNVRAVIEGMRQANIITDQDEEDGVPVLEVGEGFIRLSGLEKRRVAAFVDYAYGITKRQKDGMFHIKYHCDDSHVGVYTAAGLQLQ